MQFLNRKIFLKLQLIFKNFLYFVKMPKILKALITNNIGHNFKINSNFSLSISFQTKTQILQIQLMVKNRLLNVANNNMKAK